MYVILFVSFTAHTKPSADRMPFSGQLSTGLRNFSDVAQFVAYARSFELGTTRSANKTFSVFILCGENDALLAVLIFAVKCGNYFSDTLYINLCRVLKERLKCVVMLMSLPARITVLSQKEHV